MSAPYTLQTLSGHFKQNPTSAKSPPVLFDYSGNVAKVTLNRPNAFNVLNDDMAVQLISEASKWNKDPNIKAVIFTASGDMAFCAGGDLKTVYDLKGTPNEPRQDTIYKNTLYLNHTMARMKPIQVVFWNGLVIGAGIGFAIEAPIRIVTETSMFIMPEGKIGMHLGIVGGYNFSRMKNHLGYYLGLTGFRVKGPQWIHCGVADYFVKSENLKKLEEEIIRETGPNTTLKDIQNIVKKYQEPCEEGFPNEELINEIFGKETLEEIFQELEKRSKDSEFARRTLKLMNSNSPKSLRIMFEQLKRGRHLNYDENLKLDMRIEARLVKEKDFYEGVRCLLIDKEDKPDWEFKTISEVPSSRVSQCFEKLSDKFELSLPSI